MSDSSNHLALPVSYKDLPPSNQKPIDGITLNSSSLFFFFVHNTEEMIGHYFQYIATLMLKLILLAVGHAWWKI